MTEWEHGWKTPLVIATRYRNPETGYNIGFEFPADVCDRAEMAEYLESRGGAIRQMGGYQGAPVYVSFRGVTDKESADGKLRELMPELDKFIRELKK